jgi:hypothetical protein
VHIWPFLQYHLFPGMIFLDIHMNCSIMSPSLRTAQANEYSLDREQSAYYDLLDALRLSLKGYNNK